jgi:hypothetical protein
MAIFSQTHLVTLQDMQAGMTRLADWANFLILGDGVLLGSFL